MLCTKIKTVTFLLLFLMLSLQERLDEFTVDGFSLKTDVHSTGADARLSGPWANLRMGLSIGLRF